MCLYPESSASSPFITVFRNSMRRNPISALF